MGIVSGIFLVLIIIVVFAYGGSVIMGFVTDTSNAVAQQLRDNEIQIPNVVAGDKACDLFITAQWREKNTFGSLDGFVQILLFTNSDGKTIKKTVSNCGTVAPVQNSLLTLLDFLGSDNMKPLEFFVPNQALTAGSYSMSFVLVDENGYEKKLPHYQNQPFTVPALSFEYDYEQKLVFRDIKYGDYILELRPTDARWNDHGEAQAYKQKISVP